MFRANLTAFKDVVLDEGLLEGIFTNILFVNKGMSPKFCMIPKTLQDRLVGVFYFSFGLFASILLRGT